MKYSTTEENLGNPSLKLDDMDNNVCKQLQILLA